MLIKQFDKLLLLLLGLLVDVIVVVGVGLVVEDVIMLDKLFCFLIEEDDDEEDDDDDEEEDGDSLFINCCKLFTFSVSLFDGILILFSS